MYRNFSSSKKAFATGIASSGSGVGTHSTPIPLSSRPYRLDTGGVVYPIIFTQLQPRMGDSRHRFRRFAHLDPSARRHTTAELPGEATLPTGSLCAARCAVCALRLRFTPRLHGNLRRLRVHTAQRRRDRPGCPPSSPSTSSPSSTPGPRSAASYPTSQPITLAPSTCRCCSCPLPPC